MRSVLVVFAFVTFAFAEADVLRNVDGNTLWQEDFRNFAPVDAMGGAYWKGGIWFRKNLDFQADEDGVVFTPTGKQGELKTCIPLNKEYPWLVVELGEVALSNDYNCVTFGHFDGTAGTLGLVRQISPSVLLARIVDENTKKSMASLTSYIYGAKPCIKSMRLVKRPDVFPEVIVEKGSATGEVNPGDKLLFRITTARKVKDVSLLFRNEKGVPIKLNGQAVIQLLPPGEDDCVWEAAVDVNSLEMPGKKDAWLATARVLGGGFRKPVIFKVNLKKGDFK